MANHRLQLAALASLPACHHAPPQQLAPVLSTRSPRCYQHVESTLPRPDEAALAALAREALAAAPGPLVYSTTADPEARRARS